MHESAEQDPLDYSDTLFGLQRRRLDIATLRTTATFVSTVVSVFGKGLQLNEEGKKREGYGLALSTPFTAVAFILSFFSSDSSPDPTLVLVQSINQTVTETYEAVLQIQDELQTVANDLNSLQNQITTVFNALSNQILQAECFTAFGTLT